MYSTDREAMIDVAKRIGAAKDAAILKQLGDLIKDGLLVVEETQPVICRDVTKPGYELNVQVAVQLRLREHEVYSKLKAENKDLKERLESIKDAFTTSADPQ